MVVVGGGWWVVGGGCLGFRGLGILGSRGSEYSAFKAFGKKETLLYKAFGLF